jgi:putative FmdB family regulatory protein
LKSRNKENIMPLYDYECTACGHEFEGIAKAEASDEKTCPECSELALKKLSATTNIKFNGVRGSATM